MFYTSKRLRYFCQSEGENNGKKTIWSGMLVMVLTFSFTGCASMFHTKEATVVADSGVSTPVQVLDNEVPVYEGNLPATFPVQSGHTYTVTYTKENGEKATTQITKNLNGWFVASIELGLVPTVIDWVTGNTMQIPATTILPVSYKQLE
jgi:hypothetical protein